MKISLIAAIAKNNALGYKNQLIYCLPNDLKRFKTITTGHTIIMGKNTFDSLPKGALPNRRNVVLSRSVTEIPGCEVYKSLDDAINSCRERNEDEVFIIGGASVYKESINIADKLYMTEIQDIPENADVFFPEIGPEFDVEYAECHSKDDKHSVDYNFVNYRRV